MNLRQQLEQHIIGAVVLENSFSFVAHILSHKNFTSTAFADNALIWRTLQSMYPNKPIDLLTISYELKKTHNKDYQQALAYYTQKITSSKHVTYWAFMLLEHDIKSKTVSLLFQYLSKYQELEEKAAIQEVINHVNAPGSDILRILPHAAAFISSKQLVHLRDDLTELIDMIPAKAASIKRLDHYERMKAHVTRMEAEMDIINPNNEAAA